MTDARVHIVVGDDFGDPGRLAILEALRRGRNAHLHVTHVVPNKGTVAAEADMAKSADGLWKRISEIGAEVIGLEAADISIHVRLGEPVEALNQVAADYGADLIIVGTKDAKGLKSLGSVATGLIHHANCSVLVARPRNHEMIRKSDHPDPPRPGQDVHEGRVDSGYQGSQRVSWNPANTGVRMF